MCNQSLQEVDLFMGLQSYRQRTLSYVLKRQPAAPSIQQGTIAWSSRWAQYTFSCSFLFLLQSQTVFEPTIPVPHAVSLLPGRQWRTRGVGWAAMWERAMPNCAEDALGEGFPLHCTAHFGLFSSGYKTESETISHWYLQILNLHVQSGARLWVFAFLFFFLPSLWTQLLTQEEVGYAVTQKKKRPNKSSS